MMRIRQRGWAMDVSVSLLRGRPFRPLTHILRLRPNSLPREVIQHVIGES